MSRAEGVRRMPYWVGEVRRVLAEDGWALVSGLPAVLAGAAALGVALQLWTTPEDQVAARYLRQAFVRADAKDYETALVCFERHIKDSGPQPEIRYHQALALKAKGDHEQAESILSQLAPVDRPGYLPAHMEVARSLLGGKGPTERTLKVAEGHLRYALEGPDAIEAGALLGQILVAKGELEKAEPYLTLAVPEHPEMLLLLTRMALVQKQEAKALERAESARHEFKRRVTERADDHESRFNLATACIYLKDFRGAVDVLEEGIKVTDDPRYRPGVARVYAAWADAVAQDPKSGLGTRLALLERGLKHDATSVDLLDRLGVMLRNGGPEGEQARSTLQAMIADGKGSPGAHFILGVAANQQGRVDEARLHWEQAFRLDPGLGVVANNLAWLLAHKDPPDLDRALKLINLALEKQPKKAAFLGTRGFVLMKLKRWSEALTDLEAELAENSKSENLHRALAEVYDHLGSAELASQHRSRAEALPKTAAPGKAAGQGG